MNKINLTKDQECPDKDLFFGIMREKSYLEATIINIGLTDDWIKIWKPECRFQKYGLWMWSNSLQKLRSTTMSEFYGTGIVD